MHAYTLCQFEKVTYAPNVSYFFLNYSKNFRAHTICRSADKMMKIRSQSCHITSVLPAQFNWLLFQKLKLSRKCECKISVRVRGAMSCRWQQEHFDKRTKNKRKSQCRNRNFSLDVYGTDPVVMIGRTSLCYFRRAMDFMMQIMRNQKYLHLPSYFHEHLMQFKFVLPRNVVVIGECRALTCDS